MTNDTPNMPAGWYHAEGDAPGTQRYWDGSTWQGEPQAASDSGGVGSATAGMAGAGAGAIGGGAAALGGVVGARSPMTYFTDVITKNYVNFSGRARRAEFWWFNLISLAISIAFSVIGALSDALGSLMGIVSLLFSLAILLPSIAVAIRRLHDTGRSGWWLLIGLIPVLGWIVLLVFYFTDSHKGTNEHGPSPKYGA